MIPRIQSAQNKSSKSMSRIASWDFPAYYSLYFSGGPLDSHLKIPFEKGSFRLFSVPFCNVGSNATGLQLGENLTSYCLGFVETGFSRLPKEDSVNRELLPHQGSTQSHIRLLNIRQKVMEKLAQDTRIQDAATPALLHPDVNKRNIYVSTEEPSIITGLLDWRSAGIGPTFIYANETPDFEQGRKDASICYQTYDVCMNGLVPKLRPARLLDPTLFRLFHHCHTTWRDTRWTELGLQGSYPYSPTEEELKEYVRDYDDFEPLQRLKTMA
ncbi:hypothetical protein BDV23DRAFT_173680 [Aspergillus alliaceus]|uniref:Aminoglycoside phosphotransferase domain-containing protein n=1 Tax=Petromyces alliaceus TaxID=209559 RepID=A0A5N7C3V1_PETAA|nr:hypothetical protein BDV23DRAFT_173680 [Aspergillus alliaceus]